MKKYLGSAITAYSAILLPIFSFGALFFGIFSFTPNQFEASVVLLIMCVFAWLSLLFFAWTNRRQLYSWGVFKENGVYISVPFQKNSLIEYDKCMSCGIGVYRHAFMNSPHSIWGTNVSFIFLSIEPFPEKYRTQINLWMPSSTQIKVHFSNKLYEYLLTVLPQKNARMLKNDYKIYIKAQKSHFC